MVAISAKLIYQFTKHVLFVRLNCVAFAFAAGDQPRNLALKKPTKMSSTHSRYTSDKAVDGNKNVRMSYLHCIHTVHQSGKRAWWQVYLEAVYLISKVVITNRGEGCGEWISGTFWMELNVCIVYNVCK